VLAAPSPARLVRDDAALRRAQGCLLGQLAGDALGSLVEFRSAEQIAALYPEGVRDLADGGEWDTLAGQPTDDSEMALLLARSILAGGGYDPAAALDAYVHWHDSDPFDMGGTTRAALLAASRAPSRGERSASAAASAKQESQANGSLMRCSPLGVLGAGSPAEAAAWARADSGLTHPNRVCRESCAAYVAALAAAIGRGAGPEEAYRAASAEAARGGEPAVVEALAGAWSGPPRSYLKNQGWVLVALQNAFHQLLHAPSLEEGVIATVMAGGDTDTNGAIAGALLGAVHGRDAVPARWRRAVLTCRPLRELGARQPRPEEFWPVDAMVLAEALLALGARSAR
jgi:ADP-ribosylglycohydrolase